MSVGCIGVFDGVHLGHRELIRYARSLEADVRAITFDPHPRSVVGLGAPTSLATLDYRSDLLRGAGAADVSVLEFTPELSEMAPELFVTDILIGRFGLTHIVVGENFRFGARAAGDVELMASIGTSHGLQVHALPLVVDRDGRWSSSRIRELVRAGDVQLAGVGLARPYRITGPVRHGEKRGRQLGYPTANIDPVGNPTIPADGVYAGVLDAGDGPWPAAISVGTNPQFAGTHRTIEAYVLDRDDLDLYDQIIDLDFFSRIRGQQRFESVAGLKAQMARDVAATRDAVQRAQEVADNLPPRRS